jgi:NADH dehydrogenase
VSPTERRAAELLSVLADLTGFLGRSAWPVADVVIRWWIARPMIISGLLLAHDWNTALTLAAHEYPISWLDPGTEAALGIFLQLAGGISLVAGLGTRGGALAIVALEIATRVYYVEADLDLFRVALAAGYVLSGPGPFSLDRLFGQGLARSPVPFAAPIIRVFEKTRAPFRDGYLLGLRLWLALGLSVGALPEGSRLALSPWVAGFTAAALFGAIGPVLAIPLALGAMTRLAAVVVIVAAGWDAMASGGEFAASWTLALAFLLVSGPGPLSLDGAIFRRLKRRFLELSVGLDGLPHVVIVGAGFGGVACARALRHAPARVTLIDRHNFHLFQPLLYQVATAALSPGDIAIPIRSMFRDQPNARVMLGTVTGIDIAARRVLTRSNAVGYDYLVAATGATHSYFGQAAWARYAPGLKRVEDATEIRRRVLEAFERAEVAEDERERQALLSFVIVGAGPTGVELAGAIAELARFGMSKDFRNIDPSAAEIVLVQAAPRILPAFPEALSRRAQESLERMGVKVLIGSMVRGIDADLASCWMAGASMPRPCSGLPASRRRRWRRG